jgi:hypothetical protein
VCIRIALPSLVASAVAVPPRDSILSLIYAATDEDSLY